MSPVRMTHPTALILTALGAGHRYGFDLMDATGLASGTIYPALRRLEEHGLLRSRWEDGATAADAGRPRRRLYALTGEGEAALEAARRRVAELGALLRPLRAGEGGGA